MATAQPQLNIMKIMLWNLDGDDEVSADERLSDIDYVLDEVLENHLDNLFIFCQDKVNGPKHKRLSERMSCQKCEYHTHTESHPGGSCPQGKDLECFYKNKEACIYFPVCCINKVEYVSNQTYEEIWTQVGSDNYNYTHRMQAYVVEGHALLVSWHGPYNDFTLANQLDCFDSLVRFVERVRKVKRCEVTIVGGDFNIPVEKLREYVCEITMLPRDRDHADFPDLDVFCGYDPPPDRSNNIDYVVAWPKGRMKKCRVEVVCETYKRTPGKRPFDHPIIMYTLQYLEPNPTEHIENEAEVVEGLQNYTLQNLEPNPTEHIENEAEVVEGLQNLTLQNLEPNPTEHIENEAGVVVGLQNYMLETPSERKGPKEKDKVNENIEEATLVAGIADLDLYRDKEESVLLNDAKEMDRDSKEKEKNEPNK